MTKRVEQPVLSVVTPSYGSGRFIAETLESVTALRTPHEHLVIDGGSTDETVDLLRARQDPDLNWTSGPDDGQTHAVNKGMERARGDLIGWLNADDAYIPAALDAAVLRMRSDETIDAVFGFMDVIDEAGNVQRQYRCGRFSWARYLYAGDYVPTPTIIFRRSLLESTDLLDERYHDAADYDFYLRLLRRTNVQRVARSLVRFRIHADSKTGSNTELQLREAMEIRQRYARIPLERHLMVAIRRLKGIREGLRPPWPEMNG